jgi:FlaG/FlaF family flagellin (archaellin)
MTTLTIVKDDKFVAVDGEGLFLDAVVLAANVHAVQFDGTNGEIEYNDGTPNEAITSISAYSTITDDHAAKKAANVKAASDAATAQATLEATYGWKREQEYPSIADQLDDIYHNGIDGWKATIKAVKDTYPKETI